MKKTNNTPLYTVNIAEAETVFDIYAKFAVAKVKAGIPLTQKEMDAYMVVATEYCAEYFLTLLFEDCNCDYIKINKDFGIACVKCVQIELDKPTPVKKPNVFKRFWNWITRKK